jgi:hypothetical protein
LSSIIASGLRWMLAVMLVTALVSFCESISPS